MYVWALVGQNYALSPGFLGDLMCFMYKGAIYCLSSDNGNLIISSEVDLKKYMSTKTHICHYKL